jgi:hypothetical protein
MIYSYYQPGFDHAAANQAGDLWSGDVVSRVPRMGAIRALGRALGADGVLMYGYQPKLGAGTEIQVYLVNVADGRVIRRQGDLAKLAELTRDSFEVWASGSK